jgi:microcystin degradation protein MlrC
MQMENATLMSHVDTDLVTRKQLAQIETPDSTRSFKPAPHIELIETLEYVLKLNRITIRREQFALRRDGVLTIVQLPGEATLAADAEPVGTLASRSSSISSSKHSQGG